MHSSRPFGSTRLGLAKGAPWRPSLSLLEHPDSVSKGRGARASRAVLLTLTFLLAAASAAARPSIAVIGSFSHEFTAEPGKSYEGDIDLKNVGDTAGEVKIFSTDYTFSADGRTAYGDPGLLPRSNARWITFSPSQLTVPPGETLSVHFTLQVPDDPSLRGTYWSVLIVEPISESSPESVRQQDQKATLTIRQVVRYGIQIIADLAPDAATREIRFSKLDLQMVEGRPTLSVDVDNTGERWLVGTLQVELYDAEGDYVGRFAGGAKRLFPGTGARYVVDLSGLERGSYQALLVLDSGGDDVFGADVTLVLQ